MPKHNTASDQKSKQAIKFLLIVLAGTFFAVLFHQVRHDPLMTLGTKERSIVITSGYFPLAAFAGLAAAFWIMGSVFLALQKTLRGTKLRKGALFGIALGGMYLVGMMEAYVVYPVSLFGELYTGIVDGSGIALMSFLLGKYRADDMLDGGRPARSALPAILIISVIYVAVRYFSYTVLQIESSWSTRPLATLLWTAGMGCWCGIMYILIGRGREQATPLKQALVFGGLVFGINWLIFNLFALLFIKVPVIDLLYRSLFDTFAVITGVYLWSQFSRRQTTPGAVA